MHSQSISQSSMLPVGQCSLHAVEMTVTCRVTVLRPSDDLLQLGEPSVGGTALMQPSYFQPPGITGMPATMPPMMPTVGAGSPFIPLQGMSPTQPSPAPSMQQQFPPAMLQAGSYPVAASSVGSYPASTSFQAVPLQAASATIPMSASSLSTTATASACAAASQNPVSFI